MTHVRSREPRSEVKQVLLTLAFETVFGALWPEKAARSRRQRRSWKSLILQIGFKTLSLCVRPLDQTMIDKHPEWRDNHRAPTLGWYFDLGLKPERD